MIDAIKRFLARYGFGRRVVQVGFVPGSDNWHDAAFFTEHQRKTEKLASLARYIEGARAVVEKRRAQKKKHSDVLEAIKQAQTERLEIELGRRVFNGTCWVLSE